MNKKILIGIVILCLLAFATYAYTINGHVFAASFRYISDNTLGTSFNATCTIINGSTSTFTVC